MLQLLLQVDIHPKTGRDGSQRWQLGACCERGCSPEGSWSFLRQSRALAGLCSWCSHRKHNSQVSPQRASHRSRRSTSGFSCCNREPLEALGSWIFLPAGSGVVFAKQEGDLSKTEASRGGGSAWQRGSAAAKDLCKGQHSEPSIQPCSVALRVAGAGCQGFKAAGASGRVLPEPWACFGAGLLGDGRAGSHVRAAGRELAGSTVPVPKLGQGRPPRRAALPCPWLCESCSACVLTTMIHRGFLEKKKKKQQQHAAKARRTRFV